MGAVVVPLWGEVVWGWRGGGGRGDLSERGVVGWFGCDGCPFGSVVALSWGLRACLGFLIRG